MNFRPELAQAVMEGRKDVTRRLVSENHRSPWAASGCKLVEGRSYAVCPGRGKHAIGRIVVRMVTLELLGVLSDEEAIREGFPHRIAFEAAWESINGAYDPNVWVWRVEFTKLHEVAEQLLAEAPETPADTPAASPQPRAPRG